MSTPTEERRLHKILDTTKRSRCRWRAQSTPIRRAFHPGCETILSASSIVMPSGRRQFRKSVCASDLNAWFDRNQRLTNERQESKNPKFKSSRRPPPPRELSWEPPSSWELSWEPPSSWELPWRPPPPRELSWRPPSSRELSWEPPSSWELPWPVFS